MASEPHYRKLPLTLIKGREKEREREGRWREEETAKTHGIPHFWAI